MKHVLSINNDLLIIIDFRFRKKKTFFLFSKVYLIGRYNICFNKDKGSVRNIDHLHILFWCKYKILRIKSGILR